MITEKIGDTELSTFGLKLSRLDGNVDLPAFKQIIDEHDFESNLLVTEEKQVAIKLIGIYAGKTHLGAAIASFQNKIKSELKQVWKFENHSFEETCIVKNGANTMVYGTGVEITLTLTIV